MCLKCDKWLYLLSWMVSLSNTMYVNYIVLIVSNVNEVLLKRHVAWFLTKCPL